MDTGGQIIEDVRMWANEHDAVRPSRAAISAASGLADMHKDLPEVVGLGANIMTQMGIDVAQSRSMSRRLADASVREIVATGVESLETRDRYDVVRRSLRDVLVQEAAGHELTRRGGVDPVRALDRDPDSHGHGAKATAALRRLGIDVDTLFGSMTEHDLGKTSQGAYDKVSAIAHTPLVKALDAGDAIMTPAQSSMHRRINADLERPALAVNPLPRTRPHAPQRMQTFGRRMAHAHAGQMQMAAAASR